MSKAGGLIEKFIDYLDNYYIITKEYVLGTAVGGLLGMW